MIQQIIAAGERASHRRRWWEVRPGLRAVLLAVCALGVGIAFLPDVRASIRVTVLQPVATTVKGVSRWDGWPGIGLATFAGALAAPVLRRVRNGSSNRIQGTYL